MPEEERGLGGDGQRLRVAEGTLQVHLHVARGGDTRHRFRSRRAGDAEEENAAQMGHRGEVPVRGLDSGPPLTLKLSDPFGGTPTATQGLGGASASWGEAGAGSRTGPWLDPASSAPAPTWVRTGGSRRPSLN